MVERKPRILPFRWLKATQRAKPSRDACSLEGIFEALLPMEAPLQRGYWQRSPSSSIPLFFIIVWRVRVLRLAGEGNLPLEINELVRAKVEAGSRVVQSRDPHVFLAAPT
jgi:hypothetical protein